MKVTLETERLILRPFEAGDAEEMFSGWASDPAVTRYLTWEPHRDIEETKALLARWIGEYEKPERLNFAIVVKEENRLIGGIDVCGYLGGVQGTPVLGCSISRAYWNRGYVTEACKRLLAYLFARGYREVRIDALCENAASNRVIVKCGGVFTGRETQFFPQKNKTVEINTYIVKAP